ncbi:hypothetical protein C8Q79DRAFT_921366 [Trametes meyenii]|nr:hypothetical protein C8Q79DRAFT_921366 [Trametes meyenii]
MASTSPLVGTEDRVRSLSNAVFAILDPGCSILRLHDPLTDELCDYQLVKVPQLSETSQIACSSAYARPNAQTEITKETVRRSTSLQSTSPGHAAQHMGDDFYPLARLPPISIRSRGDGTPSLFNDSRHSDGSSSLLEPTPVRQLFPCPATPNLGNSPGEFSRGSRGTDFSGVATRVGLGFSSLFKDDGTPFDGLGSLPRRTSTPQSGYITSPTDDRAMWTPSSFAKSCMPRRAPALRTVSPLPAPRPGTSLSVRYHSTLPVRPDQDDVFLSRPIRIPGSLTRGFFRRASSTTRGGERRKSDQSMGTGASVTSVVGRSRRWSDWVSGGEKEIGRKPVWRP